MGTPAARYDGSTQFNNRLRKRVDAHIYGNRPSGLDQHKALQDRRRPAFTDYNNPVLSAEEMAQLAADGGFNIGDQGQPIPMGGGRYSGFGSNLEQNNAHRQFGRQMRQTGGGMSAPAQAVPAAPAIGDPKSSDDWMGRVMGNVPWGRPRGGIPFRPGVSPASPDMASPDSMDASDPTGAVSFQERLARARQAVDQQKSNQWQTQQSPLQYSDAFSDPSQGKHVFNTPYGTAGLTNTPPGVPRDPTINGIGAQDWFKSAAQRQGVGNKFAAGPQARRRFML